MRAESPLARRRPRASRRLRIALAAAAAAGLVTAGAIAAVATPHSTPTTAQQEQGMTPGAPLAEPAVANAGPDGMEITLDAAKTRFTVSGKDVWGESYAGTLVAPTLQLQPGATTSITLHNRLPVATNLHFHGLHTSPEGSADNPFVCIPPGASYTYRLQIPTSQQQGTFWYHSHAMGTTCPAPMNGSGGHMASMPSSSFSPGDVENQIFAGLSGALIVGDSRASLPAALRDIPVHTIVLKDVQIDTAGKIVQNTTATSIDSNADTVRLVNGQLKPVLSMRPGETQLWRFANVGADIFYRLQLDGYRFTVLAEDGNEYPAAAEAAELLVPPGKRFDVLVTAGAAKGTTALRTLAYSNGPQGDSYPDAELMKVDVSGTSAAAAPLPAGAALAGAPGDLTSSAVAQHRTLALSEDASGTAFYINGRQFSMDQSTFGLAAKLGTVEEWTILNSAGEDHPFHMHTNAFQVMSVNGTAPAFPHRLDTVVVPHAVNGVPGKVVIRQAFADYPGKWMFHCHIAAHEDNGMMGYIQVVA
ncbi:multicopper oxidase family protein [Sinomonas sp. ASV322]|uniref:multicopper oxidase family protein n=1 Tax=Sinomonas sp. ASV322 TaxID=3041920 RepID=UPI0027DCD8EA|nr:multicopper oxidase family protein [Sinomonas sp. ASV322]MDQ4501296.1 multicopper oxidase family protein [Sinomonas sp. ASV322]